jgi:hypothetical protein
MKITAIKREHRSFTGKEGDHVELDMAIINCDDGGTYEVWKNNDKLNVGDEIAGRIDKRPGKLDKMNLTSVNTTSFAAPQGSAHPSNGRKPDGGGNKVPDSVNTSSFAAPQGSAHPAGGWKPFAAAYATDIVVALIKKDQVNMSAVDEVFEHYYNMFMSKLS